MEARAAAGNLAVESPAEEKGKVVVVRVAAAWEMGSAVVYLGLEAAPPARAGRVEGVMGGVPEGAQPEMGRREAPGDPTAGVAPGGGASTVGVVRVKAVGVATDWAAVLAKEVGFWASVSSVGFLAELEAGKVVMEEEEEAAVMEVVVEVSAAKAEVVKVAVARVVTAGWVEVATVEVVLEGEGTLGGTTEGWAARGGWAALAAASTAAALHTRGSPCSGSASSFRADFQSLRKSCH